MRFYKQMYCYYFGDGDRRVVLHDDDVVAIAKSFVSATSIVLVDAVV